MRRNEEQLRKSFAAKVNTHTHTRTQTHTQRFNAADLTTGFVSSLTDRCVCACGCVLHCMMCVGGCVGREVQCSAGFRHQLQRPTAGTGNLPCMSVCVGVCVGV